MKLLRDVAKKRSGDSSVGISGPVWEIYERWLTANTRVPNVPVTREDNVLYTGPRPYTNVTLGRQTVDIPVRLEQYICPSCLFITVGYAGNMPRASHRTGCRLVERMERIGAYETA